MIDAEGDSLEMSATLVENESMQSLRDESEYMNEESNEIIDAQYCDSDRLDKGTNYNQEVQKFETILLSFLLARE